MSELTVDQKAQLDDLNLAYADALDRKNMKAWLACFAERDDASYICISQENVENDLPIAFMLDDNHARLQDRVKYVDDIWVGTFEDYQTRHMVQRMTAIPLSGSEVAMRSNLCVMSTAEETGLSQLLVAGVYEDVVDLGNGEAKLVSRKAILDTNVQPRYLVYPV